MLFTDAFGWSGSLRIPNAFRVRIPCSHFWIFLKTRRPGYFVVNRFGEKRIHEMSNLRSHLRDNGVLKEIAIKYSPIPVKAMRGESFRLCEFRFQNSNLSICRWIVVISLCATESVWLRALSVCVCHLALP